MPEKLILTTEAADLLSLSPHTLEKLRCSGAGPQFVKLGRAVAYRPSDLARWVEDRLRRSTRDAGPGPSCLGSCRSGGEHA